MPFSNIRDLDAAKQALVLVLEENKRLHAVLAKQARQIAELLGDTNDKALTAELKRLKEQMTGLQQSLFGPSSERRSEEETATSPEGNTDKKTDDKRPVKKEKQFDLPTVTQTHELADDDRECDDCGGQLVSWDEQFEDLGQCSKRAPRNGGHGPSRIMIASIS